MKTHPSIDIAQCVLKSRILMRLSVCTSIFCIGLVGNAIAQPNSQSYDDGIKTIEANQLIHYRTDISKQVRSVATMTYEDYLHQYPSDKLMPGLSPQQLIQITVIDYPSGMTRFDGVEYSQATVTALNNAITGQPISIEIIGQVTLSNTVENRVIFATKTPSKL